MLSCAPMPGSPPTRTAEPWVARPHRRSAAGSVDQCRCRHRNAVTLPGRAVVRSRSSRARWRRPSCRSRLPPDARRSKARRITPTPRDCASSSRSREWRARRKRPRRTPCSCSRAGRGNRRGQFPSRVAARFAKCCAAGTSCSSINVARARSHPLHCESSEHGEAMPRRAAAPGRLATSGRGCLAQLDVDPRFFTTSETIADLDDVRAALGAAQDQPGRHFLWHASRARVRCAAIRRGRATIVLDGVVPPDARARRGARAQPRGSRSTRQLAALRTRMPASLGSSRRRTRRSRALLERLRREPRRWSRIAIR